MTACTIRLGPIVSWKMVHFRQEKIQYIRLPYLTCIGFAAPSAAFDSGPIVQSHRRQLEYCFLTQSTKWNTREIG